eukprot:TRINITY_DN5612_c0_g2_i1.p1 TRINITY_DN5612_c0_g2~~TRINITY_DN5612_c0_g2_i1.p1  ORF type:complete len:153 (-),score=18.16 TRINITY_DN5612_c0_g2_i1:122-580(-)
MRSPFHLRISFQSLLFHMQTPVDALLPNDALRRLSKPNPVRFFAAWMEQDRITLSQYETALGWMCRDLCSVPFPPRGGPSEHLVLGFARILLSSSKYSSNGFFSLVEEVQMNSKQRLSWTMVLSNFFQNLRWFYGSQFLKLGIYQTRDQSQL